MEESQEPRLKRIITGWAAHADGWTIHAPTKDDALKQYEERAKFYTKLLLRPPIYELGGDRNDV